MRSVLVAVSVVLIVLSSLHLVASLFNSGEESADGSPPQETQSAPKGDEAVTPQAPRATDDPSVPAPKSPAAPMPGRQSLNTPTDGASLGGRGGAAVSALPRRLPSARRRPRKKT